MSKTGNTEKNSVFQCSLWQLFNIAPSEEECDARGDDISATAGYKKNISQAAVMVITVNL